MAALAPAVIGYPSRAYPIAYRMTARSGSRPYRPRSSSQVPNAAGTQAGSRPLPGMRSRPIPLNAAVVALPPAGPWPSSTKTSPWPVRPSPPAPGSAA